MVVGSVLSNVFNEKIILSDGRDDGRSLKLPVIEQGLNPKAKEFLPAAEKAARDEHKLNFYRSWVASRESCGVVKQQNALLIGLCEKFLIDIGRTTVDLLPKCTSWLCYDDA